jgi:hypothetical protein
VTPNDHVTNGLCLCPNHHVAFDRHLIWVDPATRALRLHPAILEQETTNSASLALITGSVAELADPNTPRARPTDEAFVRRYTHFGNLYDWAAAS